MAINVKMVFDNQNNGILNGSHGSVRVGGEDGSLMAYEMVLGGLGACVNHTLQSILDKKKIEIHGLNYEIAGVKRDDVPATLETVEVNITISGVDESDQKNVLKSADLATKYCSMYATLSKVANMTTNVNFK